MKTEMKITMPERTFEATHEQKNELDGLAWWIANNAWQNEKLEWDDPEHDRTRETISYIFDQCDKLGIPYWVQNSVIAYAEDWRKYISTYNDMELAKKGIKI